ncbi:alpha/beta fold hydrolase [Candidatus Berkiella aquae]|uniref:Alpha/beta hydrolase n=1 Tax=Candidatus Berkiella aquae TaxID=295108 RepID=A0A0Q9YL37_9GAMM|nr:alpha/beta hydrolase [Candidatus Berkiella aquae]MCS5710956.1 alpha/beta hydrolase [Candidatus Berkiella aquae]
MILRNLIGHTISQIIMPSQIIHASIRPPHSHANKKKTVGDLRIYQYPDKNFNINADTKIIIHAFGNGDCAEIHDSELQELTNKYANKNVVVVGMNFRNVSNSRGKPSSEKDWIEDVVSIVDHYRGKGAPLKNILLKGHSLGGAIMTMAAAKIFADELAKLKQTTPNPSKEAINNCAPRLFNNRSFSTLADEVMISILGKTGTGAIAAVFVGLMSLAFLTIANAALLGVGLFTVNWIFPSLAEFIMRPALDLTLWLTFGRMDALSAYKSLPEEVKDCVIAKDDLVIRERATIHYRLKNHRSQQKQLLRKGIQEARDDAEKTPLKKRLRDIKDSKLCFEVNGGLSIGAHNHPLEMLHTYHKLRGGAHSQRRQISGAQVMENKCKRLLKIS